MSVYEDIFKKYGLSPTQQKIINLVGNRRKVLEVGPSTGYMTRSFLKNDCLVDVLELDKNAYARLPKRVRNAINSSIEDLGIWKLLSKDYDFIIMADVLEHLVDPLKALRVLKRVASSETRLIISLPNIASWPIRKQLLLKGDFEYQESGPLDKTHLHFYTVNSIPKLLSESGWQVEEIIGTITRLPFDVTVSKIPILYKRLVEKYKNLSYYHFLVIAHK